MPSKIVQCEFCNQECRKDVYASHIKSKHTKDLAKLLLSDYSESGVSALKSFANGCNPKHTPIYSKLYEGAVYYFGVKPAFFEDQDAYGAYIKSDENMRLHDAFLTEIVSNINLVEFINLNRELQIRTPEYERMRREIISLTEAKNNLSSKNESSETNIKYYKEMVNEYKEALKCPEGIQALREEISLLKSINSSIESKNENYRLQLEASEDTVNSKVHSIKVTYTEKLQELYDVIEKERKEKRTLQEAMGKLQEAMDKVQYKIKAEAEKLFEKERKEKRKVKKAIAKAKARLEDSESESDAE